MLHKMQFWEDLGFIVKPVTTYTLVLLCECVKFVLTEAQANSLCYKCKYIFGFYYNGGKSLDISPEKDIDLLQFTQRQTQDPTVLCAYIEDIPRNNNGSYASKDF